MPLISAYYGTHQASKAGRKKRKKKTKSCHKNKALGRFSERAACTFQKIHGVKEPQEEKKTMESSM